MYKSYTSVPLQYSSVFDAALRLATGGLYKERGKEADKKTRLNYKCIQFFT